ncbi:hypothetical protein [Hoeflea sp.]|uniref:hypothetical protein n=1 Tax=Hoeflea sp. TaxID=1940281 RepID=UPI00374A09E7
MENDLGDVGIGKALDWRHVAKPPVVSPDPVAACEREGSVTVMVVRITRLNPTQVISAVPGDPRAQTTASLHKA